MFGFPFMTSLIATVAMVIGFSLIINHGIQKRKANQEEADSSLSKHKKGTKANA